MTSTGEFYNFEFFSNEDFLLKFDLVHGVYICSVFINDLKFQMYLVIIDNYMLRNFQALVSWSAIYYIPSMIALKLCLLFAKIEREK